MKKLSLALTLAAVGFCYASDETTFIPKETAPVIESQIKVFPHVDLNIVKLGSANFGFGLATGADADWFFAQDVGVFVGLDYSQLRGYRDGNSVSVDYVDIPLGVAFNFGSSSLALGRTADGTVSVLNFGPYIGLPVSKFNTGSESVNARTEFGIAIAQHTDFAITNNFGLGFHAGIKYGVVNAAEGVASRPLGIAVGVSAKGL